MSREYRYIKQYEKEILELKGKGLTKREIGEKLGFSKEQVKGVLKRNRRNAKKQSYGIAFKKRGRPPKDML